MVNMGVLTLGVPWIILCIKVTKCLVMGNYYRNRRHCYLNKHGSIQYDCYNLIMNSETI